VAVKKMLLWVVPSKNVAAKCGLLLWKKPFGEIGVAFWKPYERTRVVGAECGPDTNQ
jgi:hypothetical protein